MNRKLLLCGVATLSVGTLYVIYRNRLSKKTEHCGDRKVLPNVNNDANAGQNDNSIASERKSSYPILISSIDNHPDVHKILEFLSETSAFVDHQRELDACGGVDKLVDLFISSESVTSGVCAKVLGNIASNSTYHHKLQRCIPKINRLLLDKSNEVSAKVITEILPLAVNLSNNEDIAGEFDIEPLLDTLGVYTTTANYVVVLGTLKVLINLTFNPRQCNTLLKLSDPLLTPLTQLLLSTTVQDDVLLRVLTLCRNILRKYKSTDVRWSPVEINNIQQAIIACKGNTQDPDVDSLANDCIRLILDISVGI